MKRKNEDDEDDNIPGAKRPRIEENRGQWIQEHEFVIAATRAYLCDNSSLAAIVFEYGAEYQVVAVGCPSAFYNHEAQEWEFSGKNHDKKKWSPELHVPHPLLRQDYPWGSRFGSENRKPIRRTWFGQQDQSSKSVPVALDIVYNSYAPLPDVENDDEDEVEDVHENDHSALVDLRCILTWMMPREEWCLSTLLNTTWDGPNPGIAMVNGDKEDLVELLQTLGNMTLPWSYEYALESQSQRMKVVDLVAGFEKIAQRPGTAKGKFDRIYRKLIKICASDQERILADLTRAGVWPTHGLWNPSRESLLHHPSNIRYFCREFQIPVPRWFQRAYDFCFLTGRFEKKNRQDKN